MTRGISQQLSESRPMYLHSWMADSQAVNHLCSFSDLSSTNFMLNLTTCKYANPQIIPYIMTVLLNSFSCKIVSEIPLTAAGLVDIISEVDGVSVSLK